MLVWKTATHASCLVDCTPDWNLYNDIFSNGAVTSVNHLRIVKAVKTIGHISNPRGELSSLACPNAARIRKLLYVQNRIPCLTIATSPCFGQKNVPYSFSVAMCSVLGLSQSFGKKKCLFTSSKPASILQVQSQ